MKKFGPILLALILLLSACAPRVWYRPGATSTQRERDLKACRYSALATFTEATPPLSEFHVYVDVPYETPPELARRVEDAAKDAVADAYADYRNTFVRSYINDCMKAKGYTLVKQHR